MTLEAWEEAPLGRQHDRAAFDCKDPDLNAYLRRYARQNHQSGGSKCFIAAPRANPSHILGFYTLSPAALEYKRAPAIAVRGLARYDVPVFRLGRLAVDHSVQGRGLGGALLLRAARRCILVAEQAGGVALLIDAKSNEVARWYAGYGAIPLLDAPLSLVLPFATVLEALERATQSVDHSGADQ